MSGIMRLEKESSWVWRITRAKGAEETTTVVIQPSFRLMIGPWTLASLVSDLWGRGPSSRRFPITGSGLGPGGSFPTELDLPMLSATYAKARSSPQESQRPKIKNRKSILSLCRFFLIPLSFPALQPGVYLLEHSVEAIWLPYLMVKSDYLDFFWKISIHTTTLSWKTCNLNGEIY